jgi:methylaspartate mutase epsilon subunit
VEQGVKNVSVKCTGHGNLVQDMASSRARIDLLEEYLKKLGYNDVEIFPNLSFNLMQYPADIGVNFGVVFMNTLMTKLAKAYVSDIRTVAEAKAIPTREDMADTFRTAKAMQNYLQKQKIGIESKYFEPEYEMEAKEIRLIMDKVLEMGDGDPLVGAARAVESGVIDNPFAANRAAAGKVLGIKDADGAFRYYQTGNLPFTKEVIEYHREKIVERERIQGRKIDYETVVGDLLAVSQGRLL